jgi:hypothetical protein
MSFNALTAHRPSAKAWPGRKSIPGIPIASEYRRAPDECAVPPLDIGVWAIRLSPYRAGVAGPCRTRLQASPAFQPCSCPLALSGLGKVVASESSALNSGLLRRQFAPCVPWRTLSEYSALQCLSRCGVPLDRCTTVDGIVAVTAGHQGFSLTGCHDLNPKRTRGSPRAT